MRKQTQNWSLAIAIAAVAVLGLSASSHAQVTSVQEQDWLNSPAATSHIGKITGHAKAGAEDYRRYCVVCHGTLGDGNGETAQWVDPRPRDFTAGIFKCRSTPTGTLPTDEDLYNTIARGLDRSDMPPWNTFTKQQRADLVAWIKHFSPRWQTEKSGAPIEVPAEPEITADRVKAGQDVSTGSSVGSATAQRAKRTDHPRRPCRMTLAVRFSPTTLQTVADSNAVPRTRICTRSS